MEKVALPEDKVRVPNEVAPSRKVTVPAGTAEPEVCATVAVNVMDVPELTVVAEADRDVVVAAGVVTLGAGLFTSATFPANMSGLPSLFISTAMAGALTERFIRSFGRMLPLSGTEVKVPSPLP